MKTELADHLHNGGECDCG